MLWFYGSSSKFLNKGPAFGAAASRHRKSELFMAVSGLGAYKSQLRVEGLWWSGFRV